MSKNLEYFININIKKIKNLAQIGAHFGQEIELFEKYEIKNIFLFEPTQKAIDVLQNKILDKSNYQLFPIALGNKNMLKTIHLSNTNDGQSSSLLKPLLHKKVQPEIEFNNNTEIEVKKFSSLGIKDVNFLVMDVQGYELEVLKGFGNYIKSVEYIFTEVNRDYLYEDNVLINELDEFLKKNGFIRIWTSWRTADMPWGDAFYIKANSIRTATRILISFKNKLFTNKIFFSIYFLIDYRVIKKLLKKFFVRNINARH